MPYNKSMSKKEGLVLSAVEGFTLIEMLVVLSITLILSGILIGYSRENSRQLILINTQTKFISLISRAKTLSTTTYLESLNIPIAPSDPKLCAYGVHIDRGTNEAFIFRDKAVDCVNSDYGYDSGDDKLDGEINSFMIEIDAVQFTSQGTLTDITFIPPDPVVKINGTSGIKEDFVEIETKGSTSKAIIKVNSAGRISTQ